MKLRIILNVSRDALSPWDARGLNQPILLLPFLHHHSAGSAHQATCPQPWAHTHLSEATTQWCAISVVWAETWGQGTVQCLLMQWQINSAF